MPDLRKKKSQSSTQSDQDFLLQDDRAWEDRDGDGIPDIFDVEPDIPATNEFEVRLQDIREFWTNPAPEQEKTTQTRRCSKCNASVPAQDITIFHGTPLCSKCWQELVVEITQSKLKMVQNTEKNLFLQIRKKIDAELMHEFGPFLKNPGTQHKIWKKTFKEDVPQKILYSNHDFELSVHQALAIILSRMATTETPFFLKKYGKLVVTIKLKDSLMKPNHYEVQYTANSNFCKLTWTIIFDLSVKPNPRIMHRFSGKAVSGSVEKFYRLFNEMIIIEQNLMAEKLRWADAYLVCGEIEEAQMLYDEVAIKMPSSLVTRLQQHVDKQKQRLTDKQLCAEIMLCPFCLQIFDKPEIFMTHVKTRHPPTTPKSS